MSSIDTRLSEPLKPFFTASQSSENDKIKSTISTLDLQPHPEGGYFVETDRDPTTVPNPFKDAAKEGNSIRAASTSIYYFLTPKSPQGNFHRNLARTVHTLHRGRGRYVLIHADEVDEAASGGGGGGGGGGKEKARIETFVVGQDIEKGERLQWIVEGGKYKASYLLPTIDGESDSDGLLISETVVPGFDFRDHDFLTAKAFEQLVSADAAKEISWLVKDA